MKKKRILVGLSGGVDSAVSLYLLKQQGYDVVAGFMKNYATDKPGCTTKEDRDMAIKVAHHLGVQDFIIFDFRQEYYDRVLRYLYDGYAAGLTPNPDILCNSLIKFELFAEKAKGYGFDGIATGHYARIIHNDDGYHLLKGIDETKDQSYFLCGLNQRQLSYCFFPLGDRKKSEVRAIAHTIGLPNADRKDSQGLCFVGNVSMKDFLSAVLPVKKGNILDVYGNIIGTHDGAWFYTIGQRRGIGYHKQVYVISTNVHDNTITVSENSLDDHLLFNGLVCRQWHWVNKKYDNIVECEVKVRYRQKPQKATIYQKNNSVYCFFYDQQRALAPGQVACAYIGDEVIGCGIIDGAVDRKDY